MNLFKILDDFNWQYRMSDVSSTYDRGLDKENQLKAYIKQKGIEEVINELEYTRKQLIQLSNQIENL